MLLSLKLISAASAPLSSASLFHDVLSAVGREPLLSFLVGAILAWLFHSTLAAILLIASFLANGSLGVEGALSFILGINFGGCLPAVSSTLALPPPARRLPLANLICRGLAALAVLGFVNRIIPYVVQIPASPLTLAVGFHAAFNIIAGLCLLPFTPYVDRLMRRLVPDDKQDEDTLAAPRYLDPRALATPPVALSNAMLETVRMSEVLDRMFATAQTALQTGSLETLKLLRGIDERLNVFQTAVREYLADLSQANLAPEESRRALEIVLYVSNLEHAGDVIHLNLSDRIKTKAKESIAFTAEEQASLNDLCLIIHDNIRLATGVLTSGDVEGASRLIAQKDAFRVLENKVLDEHFKGKTRGRGTLRRGALFVDMIRDLHRINSHVVAAGYPIVDAAGLLRGSRLKGPNRKKRK